MARMITSMSTNAIFGTRDDASSERAGSTDFTAEYRCRSGARKRRLIQRQRADRVHNALTKSSVEILARRVEVGRCKKDRLSNDNGDWHEVQTAAATRQSFVSAKNPHWHDRSECFCNHESQPRLSGLQIAVERPCAFRKNQGCVPGLENTN